MTTDHSYEPTIDICTAIEAIRREIAEMAAAKHPERFPQWLLECLQREQAAAAAKS